MTPAAPAMGTTEIFLIALTIIVSVPYLAWRLLRTDYWAPLVVVQIIGGILLGPGVLGAAFPEYYAFVFNPQVIGSLNGIAWWAVMMFVFVAGLELDITDAWANRRETTITAAGALLTPLVTGAIAAAFLLRGPGWIGPNGNIPAGRPRHRNGLRRDSAPHPRPADGKGSVYSGSHSASACCATPALTISPSGASSR